MKEEVCNRLRELLSDAVERNAAEALLLSGGLDTTILAAVSKDAGVKNISKTMYFFSNKLGDFLGVEIKQPYLDKEIVEFALRMNPGLKVKEIEGRKYRIHE